jgi:hypothetical protein
MKMVLDGFLLKREDRFVDSGFPVRINSKAGDIFQVGKEESQ